MFMKDFKFGENNTPEKNWHKFQNPAKTFDTKFILPSNTFGNKFQKKIIR